MTAGIGPARLQGRQAMTYFIAHSDLTKSSPVAALYEADNADAAFEAFARDLGGHQALDSGVARQQGFGGYWVRDSKGNGKFWAVVMDDIFSARDRMEQAWFAGEDRAKVEAEAAAYFNGDGE